MKSPNNIMYDLHGCECVGLFFPFPFDSGSPEVAA